MVTKDSNVVVVALAAKCLGGIAGGLKKRFQPYATACIAGLLEKFREKKQSVVTALRDAVDAMYISTTLEAIQEDVIAALENKNPSVKAETAAFLARCFTKCTPVILNKKLLKAFSAVLLKTLNESDPTVRDSSAEALGTAMKVVGEKGISPFLTDIDNIKMTKIKEACDKAELQVKQPKVVAKKPAPAAERPASAKPSAGSTAPKPVKRPDGSATKKPAAGKAAAPKKAASSSASASTKNKAPVEREMSPEEVDEKAEAIFPPDLLSGLADSNWKNRLAAVEQFHQLLGTLEPSEAPSQMLLQVIRKKPGLKDTNFQVAKLRLDAVKVIAETFPVSVTGVNCVVTDVAERLSDIKTQSAAADALTALSEATRLEHVAIQVLDYAFAQKNPKVQVEVLNWLGSAIQEFGLTVQPKLIMDNVKKGVTAINPLVRTAGVTFVGILSVYMGSQLQLYFDGEKPALLQQIAAECDKHAGETPRSPVRGVKQESRRASVDTVLSNATEDDEDRPAPMDHGDAGNLKRVDLSPFITDTFINELSDKNWKVRAEAVQKLQNMVSESKSIHSSLGECPPVLAARLVDSNTKIAASALALCQSLATAMGPGCKQHVRVFFPNFLQGMGDSKVWIRSAAVACINTWGDQCGYREFFDGEMVADALKSGSPTLRTELWGWLAEKLPNIKTVPKEEMVACIPVLLANLEDRNADVRKNAAEAVLGVMMHTGYGPLYSACDKLKPGSQGPVKTILEKARGCLPEKPVQKSKSASNIHGDKGKANTKMGPGSTATFTKSKAKPVAAVGAKPAGRSKKDEEVDTAPLLQNNSLKNQRFIDEQKLKTLKWNFTTPREEFVEMLKDQMLAAGVNKGLIANMFHADFKYHLRAIDSLSEDLATNAEAQRANLDLILRWMTLRFFDTNPSVLLKGLEYLQTLFSILNTHKYNMLDTEAASFLPYLILKFGDPKDAVRNSVKALLNQIAHIYSNSKIFVHTMDGIKSKNARQRTECLEYLAYLMDKEGMSVCQPTPATCLKEMAKQISDRDNSVRNAAINCIVIAYFIDGEKVLKMLGQISDKDMSLLEERIKRAAKNRPVASVKPLPQTPLQRPPLPTPTPVPVAPMVYQPEPDEPEDEEMPPLPPLQRHVIVDVIADTSTDSIESVKGLPAHELAYDYERMMEIPPGLEYNRVDNVEEEQDCVKQCDVDYQPRDDVPLPRDDMLQPRDDVPQPRNDVPQLKEEPRPISGPYGLDQALLDNIETRPVTYTQPKLIEFDLHFLREPSTHLNPAPKLDTSLSPLSKMSNCMTLEWHLTQIGNRDIDRALNAMQHIETLLTSDQDPQPNHWQQHNKI
ncbi:hypothetical protein J6590_031481 [Homalodisca vitripennis]|nr:hypothetical protein J6590_031481 [Homalodisca vitripennis]